MNKDRFEQDFKTIFGTTFPGSDYPHGKRKDVKDERSERDKAGATPVRGRGDK